jgi:hypothetical protein
MRWSCPSTILRQAQDEESQIQALSRTRPGTPVRPGRPATMTHDYKRHGTTTLFAALNVLDGTVLGRCMQRHRHQEFIRFLNAVDAAVPAGKLVHAIMDNYAVHKHPRVRAWLSRHPRWVFVSPRPRPRGSTPSRASSRRSRDGASGAATSSRSSTSRPRSSAISPSTMTVRVPSSGRSPPRSSSTKSTATLNHLNESVH